MPTYLSPGVYVQEIEPATRPIEGVGTAVAAFIGFAPKGPENTPTLVSNWTQYVDTFGGLYEGAYLAYAVYGYFLNGGGNCYIVRIGTARPRRRKAGKREPKQLAAGPQTAQIGNYVFTAKNASPNAKPIKVEVADPEGDAPEEGSFKIAVTVEGRSPEVYEERLGEARQSAVHGHEARGIEARHGRGGRPGSAGLRPRNGTFDLVVPEPEEQPIVLDDISAANYIGDSADRTGFSGLEEVEDVTMVAVPDLMAAYEQGADRPRNGQGRAARGHRALRAHGRPDGDPRPSAASCPRRTW